MGGGGEIKLSHVLSSDLARAGLEMERGQEMSENNPISPNVAVA